MAVPINMSRLAALGAGFATVCAAAVLVPDPQFRVLLVWVGFVPFLWAIWPRASGLGHARAGAARGQSGEAGLIPVEDFERVARQLEARAGGGGEGGRVKGSGGKPPAKARATSGATAVSQASAAPAAPSHSASAQAGHPSFPVQRRYNGMRRMTEQYLREVRRMNLVAVWGHEGSIPRRQALDQIREIEDRMRHLSERMKFVAGRARN